MKYIEHQYVANGRGVTQNQNTLHNEVLLAQGPSH